MFNQINISIMQFISNEVGSYPSTDLFVVTEMTEEWFWHFMGCVPPIRDIRMSTCLADEEFMVGEAHSHIEHNYSFVPTYRMCIRKGDRYYSAIMPINFGVDEHYAVLKQCA